MSKLDILVAESVMGFIRWTSTESHEPQWKMPDKAFWFDVRDWKPSTDLNHALICLERAANGRTCMLHLFTDSRQTRGYANIGDNEGKGATLAIAMCLCALRASGVPESLITQAMESDK